MVVGNTSLNAEKKIKKHFSKIFNVCFSDAPVYLSYPHFYQADPSLLEPVEGLKSDREKHESFFKIQPVSYFRNPKHGVF